MHVLVGYSSTLNLEKVISELEEDYPDVEFEHCPTRDQLIDYIPDADVYFGWLHQEEFRVADSLEWIQSPSTGVDYFLKIPELRQSDVILTSASGTHGPCLAEHALAMLLAFTRGIKDFVLCQREHVWASQELRPGLVELTGSTLGIVGFGTVGRTLAKRVQGFDMRVLAVDKFPDGRPDTVDRLDPVDRLDDLLRESDYVVVTVPRTEETLGMFGPEQIALLKPWSILIGISRGGIIDEDALAHALCQERIAAAALDVFEDEPLPEESPLWDIDNLLITPHAAGGSQFEGAYVREIFVENFKRFIEEDFPLRNEVDKEEGF